MTTIAYRDGILAADSRAYGGDRAPIGSKTKIHRLLDGTLFGLSSSAVGADNLIRKWVEDGCPAPKNDAVKPDNFELILVRQNGEVFYAHDNLSLSGPIRSNKLAIGSGKEFALGAIEMGAGALQAVEVAARLDPWTGGPFDTLKLFGGAA